MRHLRLVIITLLVILALTTRVSADCVVKGHLSSDEVMYNLIDEKLFIAEGRVGDSGGSSDFEISIGNSLIVDKTQYSWLNGDKVSFVLQFVDNTAIFAVEDEPVVYKNVRGDYTDIFIRTEASKKDSRVEVYNLFFNGKPLKNEIMAIGDTRNVDILWLRCDGETFALSGTSEMFWDEKPEDDQLSFQIIVATANHDAMPAFMSLGMGIVVACIIAIVIHFRKN